MRIIDRLTKYLELKKISAYAFERTCQVANGYLKKQQKGKGSIGSDILERISKNYFDLNIIWLITGEEEMLYEDSGERATKRLSLQDNKSHYNKEDLIRSLQERVALLESALVDKEKIIALLEAQLAGKKK